MGIAVLGSLSVNRGSTTLARRDRIVLAALVVHLGEVVSVDRLADALWGDDPPASADKVVQGCVVRLRKALGAHAIETTGAGYRLTVPTDEIDAQRFERSLRRARELLGVGDADRAGAVLAEALTLWRGEPLVEVQGWDDGRIEASRLVELRLEADELDVEAALRTGHFDRVVAKAAVLVKEAPLRERRWTLLARTQYQAGRQGDALGSLRRLRGLLASELGLDASQDVDELERAMLRQDPSLVAVPARADPGPTCPYPGLAAYDVGDASCFFGRDQDVTACLHRLREASVLAVVGPSGSGKSSLVRAGVAASLKRDGHRPEVLTPGSHPMSALAGGSRRENSTLVVDQCEEVFSLCQDHTERNAFLTALSERAATGNLVLSLRADRLADVAAHEGLTHLVERGLFLIRAMTEPELRDAIEGPARQAGLVVEQGLVDLLVNEVEDQPGALPLLSHVLSQTWERREGRTLTLAGYHDSGGIRGAVAKSAESIYARVSPEQQTLLRDMLMRLVAPGEDGVPVRTRLPRRLIVGDRAHDEMLGMLINARLVTSDDGVIELAHEALARAWPRLRGWLEEDIDGQRVRHHVSFAADAWVALGRPDSELYRGARLATALDWRRRSDRILTSVEDDFLDRGESVADAERVAADQRARQQLRSNHRLRGLLAIACALVIATLVTGVLAVRQADQADQARRSADGSRLRAKAAARTADSRRLGARALTTNDISLSMLLAVQGMRLESSAESRANLLAALARRPQLIRTGFGAGPHITSLAVRPLEDSYLDPRTPRWAIAISNGNNDAAVYDQSADLISFRPVVGHPDRGRDVSVAYSPDGSILAVAMNTPDPAPVQLFDAVNYTPIAGHLRLPGGPAAVVDLDFSSNGRYLAATVAAPVGSGGTTGDARSGSFAIVWDTRGKPAPRRLDLPSGLHGLAISPDGQTIYTSWPLTAHDVATGRRLWRSPLRGWQHLDINRAGTLLAMPEWDGITNNNIVLVDPRTGTLRRRLVGHTEQAGDVRFSPSGSRIASVADDNTTLIWDARRGKLLDHLDTGDVNAVAFSPDGTKLATGGEDSALRIWDLSGEQRYIARTGTGQSVPILRGRVQPSPDGQAVAYWWRPNDDRGYRLRFYDVITATLSPTIKTGYRESTGLGAWRADRRRYVTAGDGTVRVWDPTTGRTTAHRKVTGSVLTSVVFTRDGRRLILTERSGLVRMIDANTLLPLGVPVNAGEDPCCVALGGVRGIAVVFTGPSRGQQNVGSSTHTQWNLIDLRTGTKVRSRSLGLDVRAADTAPDGTSVAATGLGGQLWLLDMRSGKPVQRPARANGADNTWVAHSEDGRQVVTAAVDGTVSLWNGHTGNPVGTVGLPEKTPVAAAFLYGGQDLLIASDTGAIYRWNTSDYEATLFACALAGRTLTRTEWQEFTNRQYQPRCPKSAAPPGPGTEAGTG